jgi:hypothetical protein
LIIKLLNWELIPKLKIKMTKWSGRFIARFLA